MMRSLLFGLVLGMALHHAWFELQYRREERWFREYPAQVDMVLRTLERRN